MRKIKLNRLIVYVICIMLFAAAIFTADIILYNFHMQLSDYEYNKTTDTRPEQLRTSFWFTYGEDRELLYGYTENINYTDVKIYAKIETGAVEMTEADFHPMSNDFRGYFIAIIPRQQQMIGGIMKNIYEFARADVGPNRLSSAPREFNISEIPFELTMEERKQIKVLYKNQPLSESKVVVILSNGDEVTYTTDKNGVIKNLPIKDIRRGFTASFSPDDNNIYRMSFSLEDYNFFTLRFYKSHIPLLIVLSLAAVGIVIVYFIRFYYQKRNPTYAIAIQEQILSVNGFSKKRLSNFSKIRWMLLALGCFFWCYAGRLFMQPQALNQIGVPVYNCAYNDDQIFETSCYFMSHISSLLVRNWEYVVWFLTTTALFIILGGRILCGFLCPMGFLQDIMYKLRELLHINPIHVSERMYRMLQPIKWLWIILFLGMAFMGADYCNICPDRVFAPALGGRWVNLTLGGILSVVLLVGSFFIKRFWCMICPLGYILGIFSKFNLFKLKKDCLSCTECGACYETCPMKIKKIYTERQSKDVHVSDCIMCGECINNCPEDKAISMTLCGKTIYQSSRKRFMSRFLRTNNKE